MRNRLGRHACPIGPDPFNTGSERQHKALAESRENTTFILTGMGRRESVSMVIRKGPSKLWQSTMEAHPGS